MAGKRKQHTAAFKAQVALAALYFPGLSHTERASRADISPPPGISAGSGEGVETPGIPSHKVLTGQGVTPGGWAIPAPVARLPQFQPGRANQRAPNFRRSPQIAKWPACKESRGKYSS